MKPPISPPTSNPVPVELLLWLAVVLLLVMLVNIRNLFGVISLLVTGAIVFAVSWYASPQVQAVFAYEWTLFKKHGKRQRASRTWQTIEEHGIVEAVERVVKRTKESAGYRSLLAEGMQDMAFEAVVLRHPELFSEEATAMSRSRLEEWGGA